MKVSIILSLFLCVFSLTTIGSDFDKATEKRMKESATQFFLNHDLIELTVRADFSALRSDRDRTNHDYHSANLEWNDAGESIKIPFKLKTRGNFRLKCENCDFPPLRFKFKTKNTVNTIFEGQKKLKLVTHCRDTSEVMQQAMLREYLVYKLYNTISDYSLRVRLVKVKYVDVITGDELDRYAFFIESKSQMAARLGVEEIQMANLTQKELVQNNTVQLALFNYMIGNTDWSIPKLHNVTLLRNERHAPPIAVPYDFDMSEFVNASYMNKYMGRELLENRYKGVKVSMDALEISLDHYQSRKVQLTDTILDFDYIDVEGKQQCLQLINSFYKLVENKAAARKAFITEASK